LESPKKILEMVDYIVKNPTKVTVGEIAKRFGMSSSNAYKYMKILEDYGIVIKNPDKSYIPGFKLVEYGSIILKRINLRDIAHSHLVELMVKTNQTVHLVLKEGIWGIYIEKMESAESLPMISKIGMRMPLYSTGFGKAILAFLSEEELEEYLKKVKLEKRTKNTITERNEFLKELSKIRARGYSIDNEENEYGIKCIGAPVFNHEGKPIAAVSVSGSANKITDDWIKENSKHVMECARKISEKLGYAKSSFQTSKIK
jgi:DNA-binding IclR family transcriptional regulator